VAVIEPAVVTVVAPVISILRPEIKPAPVVTVEEALEIVTFPAAALSVWAPLTKSPLVVAPVELKEILPVVDVRFAPVAKR
jgi:hypothetical protein